MFRKNEYIEASKEGVTLLLTLPKSAAVSRMPNKNGTATQVILKEWCKANIKEGDWFYCSAYTSSTMTVSYRYVSFSAIDKPIYFGFKNEDDAVLFTLTWTDIFNISEVPDNKYERK